MPELQLLTTIAGNINHTDFTAHGEGVAHADGRSQTQLDFSVALPNFTPLLCRTWSCVQHRTVARTESGEPNPFASFLDEGGTLLDRTEVTYPDQGGTLLMTSVVTRPTPGRQHAFQTRTGIYTGPTDIDTQLPFDIEITPLGRGRAEAQSTRRVVRADGEAIPIDYHDDLYFSGDFALPYPMVITIGGTAIYSAAERTYRLDTEAVLRSL